MESNVLTERKDEVNQNSLSVVMEGLIAKEIGATTEEEYIKKHVGESAEEYIKEKCGTTADEYIMKKIPIPTEKPTEPLVNKPSNKSLISSIFLLSLSVIVMIALLVSAIHTFFVRQSIAEIQYDRGTAYYNWINSFGNFESFDQLEAGWKVVEEDWKTRGLNVDWDFVVTVKNNTYPDGGIIYAEDIDYFLMKAIEDLDGDILGDAMMPVLGVVFLIAVIFFFIVRKKSKDLKPEKEKYEADKRRILENVKFNENLPALIAERERKVSATKAEYDDNVSAARQEYIEKVVAARDEYAHKVDAARSKYSEVIESVKKDCKDFFDAASYGVEHFDTGWGRRGWERKCADKIGADLRDHLYRQAIQELFFEGEDSVVKTLCDRFDYYSATARNYYWARYGGVYSVQKAMPIVAKHAGAVAVRALHFEKYGQDRKEYKPLTEDECREMISNSESFKRAVVQIMAIDPFLYKEWSNAMVKSKFAIFDWIQEEAKVKSYHASMCGYLPSDTECYYADALCNAFWKYVEKRCQHINSMDFDTIFDTMLNYFTPGEKVLNELANRDNRREALRRQCNSCALFDSCKSHRENCPSWIPRSK